MKTLIAFLILASSAFALDRVVVRNNRGQVIGGIVSKGGKSVYVDRKGKPVALSMRRGGTMVVKVLPSRR